MDYSKAAASGDIKLYLMGNMADFILSNSKNKVMEDSLYFPAYPIEVHPSSIGKHMRPPVLYLISPTFIDIVNMVFDG